MKKAIGLTANTSDFRPNLPQTKHLNYFMGTNPVYMAGGGDVKAGIPNYPDVNVTRGFLPAALGFKEAGDTTEKKSWYDALVTVIAGYLGKEKSQEEIEEVAADLINENPEKAKEIVNQAIQEGAIPPDYAGKELTTTEDEALGQTITPIDTSTPIDTAKATEGLPPSHPDFPGKTTTPYDVAKERISKQPELAHWLQDKSIGKFDSVQPNGGITEIKTESKNPLDLNGDGEVNMKDLEYAKNNPLLSWAIPALKKALGIIDEKLEEWSDKDEKEEVVPKVPPISEEQKLREKEEEIKGIKTKRVIPKLDEQRIAPKADEIWPTPTETKPDGGGITSIEDYPGKGLTTTEDEALGQDEQALFKATTGDTKGKKDVPAWALPLMSAGFAMMASKSPYFMQALGEGGQKGLETFAAQKTAEEEKLDKESERKLRKSQSKYYETRTQKPDIKIMTDDQGRGVYYRWDNATQDYVSLNRIAVPSNADIAKELETAHSAQMWATYGVEKQQKLIKERRNQYLGIVQSNLSTVEEKGGGWSLAAILGLIGEGDKWLEEQAKKKDGGIVSLRR
jgi:hypothetical protein